ncbi:MAG TPA: PhnD/SsuA/transferrin family substrate-binding protein [Burkholderiaceae bacterium]|nr:PhnD/SsuA/transferrin family substrate-binding protein [Burkholderiaceae bacterium]
MQAVKKATGVLLMAATIAAAVAAAPAAAEVKLGVLAPRGELVANNEWGKMAKHFSDALGEPVKLVALPPAKLVDAVKTGEVDYVLPNSAQMVLLAEKHGAKPLATLNGPDGPVFAGVIVAKKGSGIATAEQLRGKHAMTLGDTAAGAYIFQAHYLSKKGVDVEKHLGKRTKGTKQDDLVLAVQAGLADVAFVRSGQLEAMEKEGKIRMSDFVIVDERRSAKFKLRHTTALYPEWYLAATPKASPKQSELLKAVALAVRPDSAAAAAAKVTGFVEPLPLNDLKDALKTLKLPPYGG